MENKTYQFGTRAIHAGQEPDPTTGAIMTPIYQTSTYVQESPGKHKGYAYARGKNPTRVALEKCIASLENAKHGLCFSSGQGAEDAVIKLLRPGDEVILFQPMYDAYLPLVLRAGGVPRFVRLEPPHWRFDETMLAQAFTEKTRVVLLNNPLNPAEIGRAHV